MCGGGGEELIDLFSCFVVCGGGGRGEGFNLSICCLLACLVLWSVWMDGWMGGWVGGLDG